MFNCVHDEKDKQVQSSQHDVLKDALFLYTGKMILHSFFMTYGNDGDNTMPLWQEAEGKIFYTVPMAGNLLSL